MTTTEARNLITRAVRKGEITRKDAARRMVAVTRISKLGWDGRHRLDIWVCDIR